MNRLLLFGLMSLPVIALSWRSLWKKKSHGLYRFVSWECILWIFASNYPVWFRDPWSLPQLVSWAFLCASGYLVIAGTVMLKRAGKPEKSREDPSLFRFEQTTELVDRGIFRYIRHPLYSSLLLLTWGIFLKGPTLFLLAVSVVSSLFLFLTAYFDERECLNVFGERYAGYMKRTRRFIPFVF
jgi:protein-S-isoprenylcysteine O-methyltransferase Ste14